MIMVIDLYKPRKAVMNSLSINPLYLGCVLLKSSSYTQSIFDFLGIVGYPTLYTLLEVAKIKKAVFPYSLTDFYKAYSSD